MFDNKKKKTYEIDMCHGPLLKKILLFALPLMCSSVLQLLFNAADIVVVGRCAGENSLAAVGSTSSLINLLTNLFLGLSVGANVLAARYYGAGQKKELSKTVHTAMLVSFFSGIILTIFGILFTRQILIWMSTPAEVLTLAALYLRIYFLGMTATMIYNFGSALLRAVGDTKRPLYYLMLAGVVNVILNLVFVICFHLDVAGVAMATAISQCISAVLVLRCLILEKGGVHLDLKQLKIHRQILVKILEIGLPAGFQGVIFAISNVVIQASVNGFGATVIAGNSAAANIEGFVYVAMNAFYQAAISFVGQNAGAGAYKRVDRIALLCLGCVVVVGVVLGNGVLYLAPQLLSIYSKKPAVITAGIRRLSIIASTYALCGVMDVLVGILRGMGYSILPMLVSLMGACGLRLLWIATVFQIPRYHEIATVYLSYPITWTITLSVHLLCFFILRKRWNTQKIGNRENEM